MAILNMTIPGTDAQGFASLADLREQAERRSSLEFAERYPAPALHVVDIGDPDADQKQNSGVQLLTLLSKGAGAVRYLDMVGFLVKRPGNPFPTFVSLGRAANNDLVIGVDTISKLHAYFTIEAEVWHLTDYESTNGTHLNGEPLTTGTAMPLRDGDRLLLGKEITAVFLSPAALHARALA